MEAELQLERDDHVDRLALASRRAEDPVLGRAHGLVVEAELLVERAREVHIADPAVLLDDRFNLDVALELGAHGVGGVLRINLPHERRVGTPIARMIGAAAEAAAGPGPDAVLVPEPMPPPVPPPPKAAKFTWPLACIMLSSVVTGAVMDGSGIGTTGVGSTGVGWVTAGFGISVLAGAAGFGLPPPPPPGPGCWR